ncbi:hypothetical protein [Rouxiella silvae]|nr:hypothetical protein [Rouxiella silvae]
MDHVAVTVHRLRLVNGPRGNLLRLYNTVAMQLNSREALAINGPL